ncbi:MAG: two-component system response regulator AtoC [Limisphaerales bacterium]|jgi:two-component system response regulator AtoC
MAEKADKSGTFKVFVVEDDPWYRKLVSHTLSQYDDVEVSGFETGRACLDALHQQPDLITLDFRLPDMEGLEILRKIKARQPETEIVIISEQDKVETAVELLREGAFDYLVKEKDIRDRLINVFNHVRNQSSLRNRIAYLQEEVQEKFAFEQTLIGESPALRKLFRLMEKAASSDINVVVTGETGTGKEVVSKAVHYASNRKEKPFVPVNMAAIPRELVESELFGHEKGAFTGASERRIGLMESAQGGTLFLDEIGETDSAFQPKLLRALQEREIQRVGGTGRIPIDVRLIVATNKDLQEEVKAGNFRTDLYYRLIGIPVHLPPLRERGNDVIILSRHFIDLYTEGRKLPSVKLAPSAITKMQSYSWPGNIRELKAVVELAVVMSGSDRIEGEDIQIDITDSLSADLEFSSDNEQTLKAYTDHIIHSYLARYNDNVRVVAEKLNIHPSTIYRLLNKED